MIDFIPNTTTFRTVPNQSGTYRIDLSIELSNHNNNVEFSVSGNGSRFFAFGCDSGNYYASGLSKLYFEANSPNVQRDYSFVISETSFDVYNGTSEPLILGAQKNTGICQRIFNKTTLNTDGQFELELFGKTPSLFLTGNLTFPSIGNNVGAVYIVNIGDVPFSVLSGSFESVNNLSGLNKFPILVNPSETGFALISGNLLSSSNSSTVVTLNNDFRNNSLNTDITLTTYSGSGYQLALIDKPFIGYGTAEVMPFKVNNTGTQPLTGLAYISPVVSSISVSRPSYSGHPLLNYFSGYFDTTGIFYLSDKLTFSGGAFYIIQQNQANISLLNITGASTTTGFALGANQNHAVGQSFVFPFDYELTGFSLRLCTKGDTFSGSDITYCQIYAGHGVSGSKLAETSVVACSNIPSGFASGTYFTFALSSPLLLTSGNTYSIALTGAPNWIDNSSTTRKIFLLHNTGNIYGQGSGFMYNGTTTNFTGDSILNITYFPATGAKRYLVNPISGNQNNFSSITSATYDKYRATESFSVDNSQQVYAGGTNTFLLVTYSGVVSGLNIARLNISGLTDFLISGETF